MRTVYNLINTSFKFRNNREDFKLAESKGVSEGDSEKEVVSVNRKDNPLVLSYPCPYPAANYVIHICQM